MVVWVFILSNSASVSLPGFSSTASGTPIFPMSCSRPPRSRRTHADWSCGEYFILRAMINAYSVTRSAWPAV